MKSIGKSASIGLFAAVLACAVCPPGASAQTTGETTASYPRNNVRGGSIAARRPGSWIQSGIGTHVERLKASIDAFGGVTISETAPEQNFRDRILPGLVDILLKSIDALSLAIQAAITGATTTGT